MKNKKLILIPIVILLIISLFLLFNFLEKKKQKEIYMEKTKNYNTKIDDYLKTYSNSWYTISITNKEFKYVRDARQDVVLQIIPTVVDFDVEHKSDLKNYNESKIDFLFSNNKMTYLFDAIINSNENTIYKYLFINYLQNYSKINNLNNHPKLTWEINYSELLPLEKEIYNFELAKEEEYIDKYFLLSTIEKSWLEVDQVLKWKIYWDLFFNFSSFKDNDKLLLLLYLSNLWELDKFLTGVQKDLPKLFSWLNDNDLAYYTYLLSINDKSNEEITENIKSLETEFDNLNLGSKIMFVWILNNMWMDYSKYYDEIEKIDNYSLSLKELFIKFLVYSNLKNEYTSIDSYSKFWFSSGMQVNRKEEFILSLESPFFFESYSLDKVIYDDLIDTRVWAFDWKKFFLNITLKQK